MCMVAAKLSCKRAVVGIRWAKSYPGCMNRLRKRYSQGGSFLAGKAAWVLSEHLPTACSLMSGHG